MKNKRENFNYCIYILCFRSFCFFCLFERKKLTKEDIRLFCICNSFSFVRTYCILILLGVVLAFLFFSMSDAVIFSLSLLYDYSRFSQIYFNVHSHVYINRACLSILFLLFCQVFPMDKRNLTQSCLTSYIHIFKFSFRALSLFFSLFNLSIQSQEGKTITHTHTHTQKQH